MVSFEVSKFYCGTFVTIHRVEPKLPPPTNPSSHTCTWMPLLGSLGRGMRRGSSLGVSAGFHTSDVGQEHSKTPGSPRQARQYGEGVVDPNVRLPTIGPS